MVVRCPHVIDLLNARGFQRIGDAAEIALARVAGIDQQRLAGWTNEERRLATLGVDVVDVQRTTRALGQQAPNPRRSEKRASGQ